MYLVSIYFDEKTNKRIQSMIDKVAEKTGNRYMKEANVPPHMTVAAFETRDECLAVEVLEQVAQRLQKGKIQWTSVGQFFPYVLFIAPVLNQYLHEMSTILYEALSGLDGVKMSPNYQPFSWQPHATIGKKLSQEEMKTAFETMQSCFGVFEGEIVKIGIAKPNPHRNIAVFSFGDTTPFKKGHH